MTADETKTSVKKYTERGWVCHPLTRPDDKGPKPGKRPVLRNWENLTETPADIDTYINKGNNVGLVCGKASGVTVLDFDHWLFFSDLFGEFKIDTLRSQRTEGRGHMLFQYCEELHAQKHHDLGIEVLSDGSNAVLPPSIHESGDTYKWINPNAPLIEMPIILKKRLGVLFDTETQLKKMLAKCRHCFRDIIKRKPDMHGGEGREYMLAVCTDLKATGAKEEHIRMFAKFMYREGYDEERTLREFENIDPAKTWQCETLQAKLPSFVDFVQCKQCTERKENYQKKPDNTHRKPQPEGYAFELVSAVQEVTPIYYDRARIYWRWNPIRLCYEIVDETDLLLGVLRTCAEPDVIKSEFKNKVMEAMRLMGRERVVKPVPKSWVQFADCVCDIFTGERFDATPDYFFVSPIPHKVGTTPDTPILDKLFMQWVGSGDPFTRSYEIIAYCLYNGYPIHRVIGFYGGGRNGKGQNMQLINTFLGDENTTACDLDRIIESRFEAAKMYKKLAAFSGETNFNVIRNTSQFKKITGDDKLSGEFKYKSAFDFTNTAKFIIATNSLPMTIDKTRGFMARWLLQIFPNEFDEGVNIVETIPEIEYENLAAKCLKILPELIKRGKFTGEGTIDDRARIYEKLSNPVSVFIEQYCIKDMNAITPLWQLYEQFKSFQIEAGYRQFSSREFQTVLNQTGFDTKPNHWFVDPQHGEKQWTALFGLSLKEFTGKTVTAAPILTEKPPMENIQVNVTEKPTSFETRVASAGEEWQHRMGKAINSETVVAFCFWYCETIDKTKKPGDIRALAGTIFGFTPERRNAGSKKEQEQPPKPPPAQQDLKKDEGLEKQESHKPELGSLNFNGKEISIIWEDET